MMNTAWKFTSQETSILYKENLSSLIFSISFLIVKMKIIFTNFDENGNGAIYIINSNLVKFFIFILTILCVFSEVLPGIFNFTQ